MKQVNVILTFLNLHERPDVDFSGKSPCDSDFWGGFESEITAGAWGTGGGRGGGLKIKSVIRFADIGLYYTLVGRWPRWIFDF